MLTSRQEKILELIVHYYVQNANPIGSKAICDELECSSATVRNEMAQLEDLGYLEKAHISSGRIPSEAGYRYYVDHLMQPKKMSGDDMLKLQIIFNNSKLEISDCLHKSLEIVSEMTDYTSVVLGTTSNENKLKKVEVLPLEKDNMLAIVVTDKGHVEHKSIHIDNLQAEEVQKTVELINKLLVGTPIDEINMKLEFEIKPIIKQYVMQHEAIYNAFYDVFHEFTTKNVSFVGKRNMLNLPEFHDIDALKRIYQKLDEKEVIDSIEEQNGDINIYIGKESNLDEDVTVIKTKYKTATEEGTIAIIGPKRMEYDRVVGMLEYIKENIEKNE